MSFGIESWVHMIKGYGIKKREVDLVTDWCNFWVQYNRTDMLIDLIDINLKVR